MKNITFTMLKPDSVSKGNIGKIIDKIIQDGFEIIAMKYFQSAESLDKKKMLFGKPNYLVGDKHLISPITFYVDALTTDKSKPGFVELPH